MSDAGRDLPDRAAATDLLAHGERLLWFWQAGGPAERWRMRPGVPETLVGASVLAWTSYRLSGDHLGRYENRLKIAFVLALVVFVIGIFRLWRLHGIADTAEGWLNETAPVVAYGLTQHRLLMLARSRAWDVPLVPGEPVIQYGNFRIDRPDRRGCALIRRMPPAQQHSLFAALQLAHAIRAGRAETPA